MCMCACECRIFDAASVNRKLLSPKIGRSDTGEIRVPLQNSDPVGYTPDMAIRTTNGNILLYFGRHSATHDRR